MGRLAHVAPPRALSNHPPLRCLSARVGAAPFCAFLVSSPFVGPVEVPPRSRKGASPLSRSLVAKIGWKQFSVRTVGGACRRRTMPQNARLPVFNTALPRQAASGGRCSAFPSCPPLSSCRACACCRSRPAGCSGRAGRETPSRCCARCVRYGQGPMNGVVGMLHCQ